MRSAKPTVAKGRTRAWHDWFGALALVGAVVAGAVVLVSLALSRPEVGNQTGRPPRSADHAKIPMFDVLMAGDSAVVVTNLSGWTREQVTTYLCALKKARAQGALAGVGIPAPSETKGYNEGVVYLVDGHPDADALTQFVRHAPPGYERITPAVRGLYRWPPDHLLVGFPDGTAISGCLTERHNRS